MSDTISNIYYSYEEYLFLCKNKNLTALPLDVDNGWYEQYLKLEKECLNNLKNKSW